MMRFKLDETFGARTQHLFSQQGHDVATVREEQLLGASDQTVYEVSCKEGRCLVTLDLDFANAGQFPPERCGGIVIVRVPRNPSLALLERLVAQFLTLVKSTPMDKELWIVEVGRIRIRQREN
jgi:predicted nuclease of predicted toxin-antitoxin system